MEMEACMLPIAGVDGSVLHAVIMILVACGGSCRGMGTLWLLGGLRFEGTGRAVCGVAVVAAGTGWKGERVCERYDMRGRSMTGRVWRLRGARVASFWFEAVVWLASMLGGWRPFGADGGGLVVYVVLGGK